MGASYSAPPSVAMHIMFTRFKELPCICIALSDAVLIPLACIVCSLFMFKTFCIACGCSQNGCDGVNTVFDLE